MSTIPTTTHPAVDAGPDHLQLFLQVQGRPDMHVVALAPDATMADLLAEVAPLLKAGGGLADLVLSLADAEHPLDVHRRLADVGIGRGQQIHIHHPVKVDVQVRFNGSSKHREFSPAATFDRIHTWATGPHGFSLSEVDASEHILQVAATGAQPEPSDHLGIVVARGTCSVLLDLVPKHRIEG